MGVEGKDRAKVLEAGAASLVQPARAGGAQVAQGLWTVAGRPVATFGRRQVDHLADRAQRDQSDADDDLAARPRARRVDRIDAARRRRGPVHRASRPGDHADLRLRRRTLPACRDRLAENRRLAAMVRFSGRSGGRSRVRPPICAARSSACRFWTASSRSRSARRRRRRTPARRCATVAICLIASAT